MKAAVLLFACSTVAATAASRPSPQVDEFLYAIRQVESGDHYDCPRGRMGEVGPYQFRRDVWRKYTTAAFSMARTEYADEIALRHYAWIVSRLRDANVEPSPWAVAAAWNGGVGAVVRGTLPRAARSYAARVSNLVRSQEELRAALTPKFRLDLASSN